MKVSPILSTGILCQYLHEVSSVSDHWYEETISTRLTFKDNGLNFDVLPFDEVAHTAKLGTTTIAALVHSIDAWKLYSIDTAVTGSGAVNAIDVNLTSLGGACIAEGPSVDTLFVLVPADGVYSVDCQGAVCSTELVSTVLDDGLKGMTSCAASSPSLSVEDGAATVVAATTPQGLFAVSIAVQDRTHRRDFKADMSLVHGLGVAPPAGVEVTSVAVSVGWGVNGRGVAIAASTKDHVYYASSPAANTADAEGLVWRDEWCTSPDMTGGAVDWPPAQGSGLDFESPLRDDDGSNNRRGQQDEQPRLWLGGQIGLQELSLEWKTFRRLDGFSQGLPYENVTAVRVGGGGELFVGTTMGLARRLGDRSRTWRYYYGARWLPGGDGHVRHLATPRQGAGSFAGSGAAGCSGGCSASCGDPLPGAVVVTLEGIAILTPQCWTLASKTTALEAMIEPLHSRDGQVGGCDMSPNDLATCVQHDSDNDGLWTSVFTNSQIFRAATLAKEAGPDDAPSAAFNESVAFVKKHFAAQKKLFDVAACYDSTSADVNGCMEGGNILAQGFMARSFGPYGMEPLGPAGDQSPDNHRGWYNSTTYPGLIWKGDTSSDEVGGHMLTFAALVALVPAAVVTQKGEKEPTTVFTSGGTAGLRGGDTEDVDSQFRTNMNPTLNALATELKEERAQAIALSAAFLDGILANNYNLMDPGLGTPTVWGRWDPSTLNDQRYYTDERGLNSAQIISFLRSGSFITGNSSYDEAADYLKKAHGYGVNAVNAKITAPGDVNYSDDDLALMPLYAHIVLTPGAAEKDPELVCSFARYWEQGTAAEAASVWAAMHTAVNDKIAASAAYAETDKSGGSGSDVVRGWAACGGLTETGFARGTGALADVAKGTIAVPPNAFSLPNAFEYGASIAVAATAAAEWHPANGGGGSIANDAATAVWSLRTSPLNMVSWATRNSHRTDVVLDKRGNTRFGGSGSPEVGRVLPGNERSLFRWNSSPKVTDAGTWPGGASEDDPSGYLLGYWMSRYHGLVEA